MMQTSSNIKKTINEYCESAKRRFAENGNKLFLSESAKGIALAELCAILQANRPKNFLCIVESDFVAAEIAAALKDSLGNMQIFSDVESLVSAIKKDAGQGDRVRPIRATADSFINQYPNLILTSVCKNGKSLLHHPLCKNDTKGGTYQNTTEISDYCVSDYLTDCGYEFVVIDNVYSLFPATAIAHTPADQLLEKEYSPAKYDMVELLGTCYFFDTEHSFRRVRNLVWGASASVLISDFIVGENLLQYYLANNLLQGGISMQKARKTTQKMTADDAEYDEMCGRMRTTSAFCKDDKNVISACLSCSSSSKQKKAKDFNDMQNYIGLCLSFLSDEDICLELVSDFLEQHPGGNYTSVAYIDEILNSENDFGPIAKCFSQMFFQDAVKGEFESSTHTIDLFESTVDELKNLLQIFPQYGMHHNMELDKPCNPILFVRENSAFQFVLRKTDRPELKVQSYSVIGNRDDVFYKCSALCGMLKGNDGNSVHAPLLVITNEEPEMVAKTLSTFLKDETVLVGLKAYADQQKGNTVVVCPLEFWKETTLLPQFDSIVFLDLPLDVSAFHCAQQKAVLCAEKSVLALISDRSIEGLLARTWENDFGLFSGGVLPPARITEIFTDKDETCNNAVINQQVKTVWNGFVDLLDNPQTAPQKTVKVVKQLFDLIQEYFLEHPFQNEKVEDEIAILSKLSQSYSSIYANAVSMGGDGDVVETVDVPNTSAETTEEPETHRNNELLFNVCSLYLRHKCDLKNKSCRECELSERMRHNRFEIFRKAVDEFFADAKKAATQIEEQRKAAAAGLMIKSTDTDRSGELIGEEVDQAQQAVSEQMKQVKGLVNHASGIAHVPYFMVDVILKQIYDVYFKMFRKYFESMYHVFIVSAQKVAKNKKIVSADFLKWEC